MSQPQLDTKQYVPVSGDERWLLREEAAQRGTSTGLLARVLFLYGLEHIDDPEIIRRIEEEKSASKQRISKGARAATQARWGTNQEEGK